MQVIPVQVLPNQTLNVQLNGQAVQLNIYQTAFQVAMDVFLAGGNIVYGQPCQELNLIVRRQYLGFDGDLCWIDTQGDDDPIYTGLGTRFQLLYLEDDDIAALGLPTGES